MSIDWRTLRWAVGKGLVNTALVVSTGCGNIFIREPTDSQTQVTTPFTLQAQKNENAYCAYSNGSFQAYIDKGQASQINITSAFTRPPNSNIWTATDYYLPVGTHTFNVEGRFGGSLCLRKFDSDSRALEVLAPSSPDLTIGAFDIVPTSPSTADPTIATIAVSNQGGVTAGSTILAVRRNGAPLATLSVPTLTSGANVTLSQNLTFPTAGTYTIDAVVDPNNTVTEANDTNNSASITVVVRGCGAGDLAAALEAARERIMRGDNAADLDGDCRDEYKRTFDGTGAEIEESIDINGDGTAEIVWNKSGPTKTYRVDVNQDGTAELELTATPSTPNPSIVDYVRTWDTSGDGVPDRRILYTIDPSQPTYEVRHESDDNQDGNYDFEYNTTAQTLQDAFYDVVTTGPNACNDAQRQAIESAFYDAWHDGTACLRGIDVPMAMTFLRNMGRYTFEISCDGSLPATTCARAADAHKMDGLFGPPDRLRIKFNPTSGFDGTCGSVKQVLFHELMHYASGVHEYDSGQQDPGDRVYACAKTCFGAGDSISCAACVGKENGTSACSSYPQVPCPADVPTLCRCNDTIYPNAATCGGSCPVNLGCFAFQCKTLGPCR